eukprot:6473325-Amphidinium_carterae.6
MLGLMEPESLAIYGYKIANSKGIKDKLDSSMSVASIGMIALMSSRTLDSLAATCIFVLAAGSAPVRALASQELVTTSDVLTATSECVACSTSRGNKGGHRGAVGTQTDQSQLPKGRVTAAGGPMDIYVYPQGNDITQQKHAWQCGVRSTRQGTTLSPGAVLKVRMRPASS